MIMPKRVGVAALIAITIAALSFGLSAGFSIAGIPGFDSTAVAYGNRTMSPVRVQNVARSEWAPGNTAGWGGAGVIGGG